MPQRPIPLKRLKKFNGLGKKLSIREAEEVSNPRNGNFNQTASGERRAGQLAA
jgi:hypothetical protein